MNNNLNFLNTTVLIIYKTDEYFEAWKKALYDNFGVIRGSCSEDKKSLFLGTRFFNFFLKPLESCKDRDMLFDQIYYESGLSEKEQDKIFDYYYLNRWSTPPYSISISKLDGRDTDDC